MTEIRFRHICDSCRNSRNGDCNVQDQMKGILDMYQSAYRVKGFVVFTNCGRADLPSIQHEQEDHVNEIIAKSCPTGKGTCE